MTLTELRTLALAATPEPWGYGIIHPQPNVRRRTPPGGWACGPYCSNDDQVVKDAAYIAALSPERVLAMLDVIEAAKAMRDAGVLLSRCCIEPPYMSEKAAVNEFIGIFDGPLQRGLDAALAKL